MPIYKVYFEISKLEKIQKRKLKMWWLTAVSMTERCPGPRLAWATAIPDSAQLRMSSIHNITINNKYLRKFSTVCQTVHMYVWIKDPYSLKLFRHFKHDNLVTLYTKPFRERAIWVPTNHIQYIKLRRPDLVFVLWTVVLHIFQILQSRNHLASKSPPNR